MSDLQAPGHTQSHTRSHMYLQCIHSAKGEGYAPHNLNFLNPLERIIWETVRRATEYVRWWLLFGFYSTKMTWASKTDRKQNFYQLHTGVEHDMRVFIMTPWIVTLNTQVSSVPEDLLLGALLLFSHIVCSSLLFLHYDIHSGFQDLCQFQVPDKPGYPCKMWCSCWIAIIE